MLKATGTCNSAIPTFTLNELLGTKLRALYQRSKGRDLFDLYYASQRQQIDLEAIVRCFKEYITLSTQKRPPSQKEFLLNVEAKENDLEFTGDIVALLRPEVIYDQAAAFKWLRQIVAPLI